MKSNRLYLRLSDDEKKAIECHAIERDMTVSQYILSCVLAEEQDRDEETKSIVLELRRIGTNLNQIAKVLNTQTFTRFEAFQKLHKALVLQYRTLEKLRKELIQDRAIHSTQLNAYHAQVIQTQKLKQDLALLEKQIQLQRLTLRQLRIKKR